MTAAAADTLSPSQTHALFDILIHHQLYSEIEAFKYPSAITTYGYPFRKHDGIQTTSPLLQNMLNKFVLRLPGLNNVGNEFWADKIKVLVMKLGEAELSESYDKGAIGSRKALATAVSSVLEYVGRGMLGGYPRGGRRGRDEADEMSGKEGEYDRMKADDILRAWDDAMRAVIYGDLLDEVFKQTGETGRLEDHSSLIQAAHEYILLNLASFMHHIFIMSPDGQYLLRLLENIHRLIPYYMIKQTLRVGNAATMINGMVKLVLTKLSVTAVTNWIGLTNNSNDGMNLMQQIISTVMAWDTSEFQKRAQKLESQREAPDKKVFKALKAYAYASRDKHDAARSISIAESKSIIGVILETSDSPVDADSLTEHQHALAMEYYSTLLSIRDREELTKILCKLQPDILTSAIRDGVSAFDPVIRAVHNAVDLSGTVTDAEAFLSDLIKISKPKRNHLFGSRPSSRASSRSSSPARSVQENPPASIADGGGAFAASNVPTVEDYVQLLRKHIPSSHKFLHQVCKNAPDLANQYLSYAKACVAEFRVDQATTPSNHTNNSSNGIANGESGDDAAAGNMTLPLQSLFSSLPPAKQNDLLPLLTQHSKHLTQLKSLSKTRLETIMASSRPPSSSTTSTPTINNATPNSSTTTTNAKPLPRPSTSSGPGSGSGTGTTHGPGIYLSRWHSLLDSTLITPATLHGRVRHGWEVKGELDGKGLKTDTLLLQHQHSTSSGKQRRGKSDGSGSSGGGSGTRVVDLADGTGDALERRERKKEAKEEERTVEVWGAMRDGWVGVCRGLEVMGPLD